MYNEDIAAIPVQNLLSQNCLVAVWCTNAPTNITAVKNVIFPRWGVEYVATWYWLKVTVDLQPLCGFGTGSKKQPYERIILGRVGDINNVPDCQLVVSVPSALHSHKPPLLGKNSSELHTSEPPCLFILFIDCLNSHKNSYNIFKIVYVSLPDILSPFAKAENPQTLELFARYLLPNTTSVGYEPLKWQHDSLYEEIS